MRADSSVSAARAEPRGRHEIPSIPEMGREGVLTFQVVLDFPFDFAAGVSGKKVFVRNDRAERFVPGKEGDGVIKGVDSFRLRAVRTQEKAAVFVF